MSAHPARSHRRLGRLAITFRLVTATGYAAFGVVDKGNITVTAGGLLTVP